MILNKKWLKSGLLVLAITPLIACADSSQENTAAQTPSSTTTATQEADASLHSKPATPATAQQPNFEESVHYVELFDPVPKSVPADKIEVVELFWYSCPHCYQLEPELSKWKKSLPKDVELVQIPGVFKDRSGKPNPNWAMSARAYYALEALGALPQTHENVFAAIHEQGRRLNSIDAWARFVASQGVDEAKFREAMSSLAVDTKTRHAIDLTEKYGLTGVPALIVDGRYRVLNKAITSYGEMFQIVDFLIEKERSRLKTDG